MRRLKSLFLILLALWLPVQTAVAAVMPWQFVQQQGESCHLHDEEAVAQASVECDDCRICHLATAGFLLAFVASVPAQTGSVLVVLPTTAAPPSHVGDPPQRPPRRSN